MPLGAPTRPSGLLQVASALYYSLYLALLVEVPDIILGFERSKVGGDCDILCELWAIAQARSTLRGCARV